MFSRPAAPIFYSVSRVSEVTLGTFLVGFSADFVFCFFFGGILGLVRPSGPWCFRVRQRRFFVLFLGFRSDVRNFFWWDSRTSSSFRAMVFPRPAAPIFCSVSRFQK